MLLPPYPSLTEERPTIGGLLIPHLWARSLSAFVGVYYLKEAHRPSFGNVHDDRPGLLQQSPRRVSLETCKARNSFSLIPLVSFPLFP